LKGLRAFWFSPLCLVCAQMFRLMKFSRVVHVFVKVYAFMMALAFSMDAIF
jgi:hypothetical protein